MADKREKKRTPMWLVILRSALIACAVSVLLAIGFAFVLKSGWLGMDSVRYFNPVLKVVCAAAAALLAVLKTDSKAPLVGALAAVLYMAVSFVVFSLISGSFGLGVLLFADLGMCALTGAITGMLINLKR